MYSAKLLCFASFKAISAVELSATKRCWIFQVPVVLLLLNNTSTFYLYKYKSFFQMLAVEWVIAKCKNKRVKLPFELFC